MEALQVLFYLISICTNLMNIETDNIVNQYNIDSGRIYTQKKPLEQITETLYI